MCGLCGLFGGADDWTATSANPQVFAATLTRRAERARRVRLVNSVLAAFGLRVDDWQGTSFVLSGPTGKSELVDTLPDVWRAARSMLGRPIDPLDPGVLAAVVRGRP